MVIDFSWLQNNSGPGSQLSPSVSNLNEYCLVIYCQVTFVFLQIFSYKIFKAPSD